jgi:hypothetical protein
VVFHGDTELLAAKQGRLVGFVALESLLVAEVDLAQGNDLRGLLNK